ncbi:MAG: hypothetical protein AAGF79_14510 [Pseudomonadota bacterium]
MNDFNNMPTATFSRPPWVRWLTAIFLIICVSLIVLAMLAQPKISAQAHLSGEHIVRMPDWLSFTTQNQSMAGHTQSPTIR